MQRVMLKEKDLRESHVTKVKEFLDLTFSFPQMMDFQGRGMLVTSTTTFFLFATFRFGQKVCRPIWTVVQGILFGIDEANSGKLNAFIASM